MCKKRLQSFSNTLYIHLIYCECANSQCCKPQTQFLLVLFSTSRAQVEFKLLIIIKFAIISIIFKYVQCRRWWHRRARKYKVYGPKNVDENVRNCSCKLNFTQSNMLHFRSQRVCNKCKTKDPCVVLQYKHAYCKDCFLASTTHKFRSYLGSLKLSHSNDNILIVHNCGHQSTALLHLLRTGLDISQYKKIKIKPLVLFIEGWWYSSTINKLWFYKNLFFYFRSTSFISGRKKKCIG